MIVVGCGDEEVEMGIEPNGGIREDTESLCK